ncbi:hypothetical protein ABEB36_001534 [Hypothenemus hampei]|uniref:Phosphatidylinositol N-acetylglucosaminyltransferase subunit Q n=1 Tax=Hypothenemus hampei TaxID=57062 RepID=A0ABD1FI22_HYPHA
MVRNTLLFLPKLLLLNKTGFIKGFFKSSLNCDCFFVTSNQCDNRRTDCIGYIGKRLPHNILPEHYVFVDVDTENIYINGEQRTVTQVFYDLDDYRNASEGCEIHNENSYGVFIRELIQKLKQSSSKIINKDLYLCMLLLQYINVIIQPLLILSPFLKNCQTFNHLLLELRTTKWFLTTLNENRKFTLKHRNVIVTKLADLMLGFGFIYLCLKYHSSIIPQFQYISQDFVTMLRKLLIYLMGVPIGLKLNYTLNHSFGKFFFYHINMWRMFLMTMQPYFEKYFTLLLIPSAFGITFQIALICDLLSMSTFHIYCIYVYAARVFSLQVKGLISLWRLFIGRKSNPLRSRIDSCDYSSNQLFIGTLAFTVLLFLLPTVTMYYVTFTLFRVIVLILHTIFTKISDYIWHAPIYIFILWLINADSIKGSIYMQKDAWHANTQIELRLARLSLKKCLETFSLNLKDTDMIKNSFSVIASHLITGKLI